MLETILLVAVVVAVGAFIAMRAKLKDKDQTNRAEIAVVNNDVETIAPPMIAEPVDLETVAESADPTPVVETVVAAETADDTTVEPNKKPKAPRKTTRARKK